MARAMANLKAVIVGDWDVLKVHFLKQAAGLYERDFANTYLYMQDYGLCVELYDKAVNLAIWNTSKFVMHFNIKHHPYSSTT